MTNEDDKNWENATWEGSRRAMLRVSLKLSARERFEALEELAQSSDWLARAHRVYEHEAKTSSRNAPNLTEPEGAYHNGEEGSENKSEKPLSSRKKPE